MSGPSGSDIRLDARPDSYWSEGDPAVVRRSRIKGTFRRYVEGSMTENGLKAAPDDPFFAESLTEEERHAQGQGHPGLMGGEYLPDLNPHEVEIARIGMDSVTGDVVSIRARRVGTRIHYRVVDEYDDVPGEQITCTPTVSERPLTLGELVDLINTAEGATVVRTGWSGLSGTGGRSLRRPPTARPGSSGCRRTSTPT